MIYTIHMIQSRPVALLGADEDARFDGLVAISDGWAKWAVVAPPIWLAVHRLWFALLIYVLVMALGLVLFATPFAVVGWLICTLPGLYLLLEGHELQRSRLEAKGYVLAGVVEAPSESAAIGRYLQNLSTGANSATAKGLPSVYAGAGGPAKPSRQPSESFTLFPVEDH